MDEAHTNEQLGTIIVSIVIAIRLIAAPLFLYTFTHDLKAWALCILLVAVFTDALDGHVARKLGGTAPFLGPYSAYSDAVADFILILAAFSAFVIEGLYPFWMLLLIAAMFAQFVLTSRLARPIYDPVGKYYGVFLFCAAGVTLAFPFAIVRQTVVVVILGFTLASVISRGMFLLGFSKKRALDQDRLPERKCEREVLNKAQTWLGFVTLQDTRSQTALQMTGPEEGQLSSGSLLHQRRVEK